MSHGQDIFDSSLFMCTFKHARTFGLQRNPSDIDYKSKQNNYLEPRIPAISRCWICSMAFVTDPAIPAKDFKVNA